MKITIPLQPVSASRPRVTKHGHTYYQKAYANYKRDAAYFVKKTEPMRGPLEVDIVFYMQIPKGTPKKDADWMDGAPHCKKPDIDNLLKAALDLLSGTVIGDDAVISRVTAAKVYTHGEPCTVIDIGIFEI